MRIGIDVGGTYTDAVLMNGDQVVRSIKTPTTSVVSDGIVTALRRVLEDSDVDRAALNAVMIGTTHFTNAVVERKHLRETACIRLGLPATASLPPMVDWPGPLREAIGEHRHLARGGHEFDGREISPLDEAELRAIAGRVRDRGITAVAISAVFSPVDGSHEERAAGIVHEVIPGASVTLSHRIGRIGLLERENAAILNGSLGALARKTVDGFTAALTAAEISAPLFITQNDGTLMSADFAAEYPVLTFASGPTNSMRGAAFLSGLEDAVVIDIGGTTTDVGPLRRGFPRTAGSTVSVGGVRTNFRMPDTHSVGLGGGSVVTPEPLAVGPHSVGYELTSRALVFGGDTLTATDVMVAAGKADIGDPDRVRHVEGRLIADFEDYVERTIGAAVERVKASATPLPAILVGGGSFLLQREIAGVSETIVPKHHAVANAIGAAIAQVGGSCDRVFSLDAMSREAAVDAARQEAADRAVAAGADPATIGFLDIDAVPLGYLPGNALRVTVKAVGDLQKGESDG